MGPVWPHEECPFRLLNVQPEANAEEIRKAWQRGAKASTSGGQPTLRTTLLKDARDVVLDKYSSTHYKLAAAYRAREDARMKGLLMSFLGGAPSDLNADTILDAFNSQFPEKREQDFWTVNLRPWATQLQQEGRLDLPLLPVIVEALAVVERRSVAERRCRIRRRRAALDQGRTDLETDPPVDAQLSREAALRAFRDQPGVDELVEVVMACFTFREILSVEAADQCEEAMEVVLENLDGYARWLAEDKAAVYDLFRHTLPPLVQLVADRPLYQVFSECTVAGVTAMAQLAPPPQHEIQQLMTALERHVDEGHTRHVDFCRGLWSLKAEMWVQGPAHRNQLQLLQKAAKEAHDALLQIDLKTREISLPPNQQQNPDFFMLDTLDSPKLLQLKGLFAEQRKKVRVATERMNRQQAYLNIYEAWVATVEAVSDKMVADAFSRFKESHNKNRALQQALLEAHEKILPQAASQRSETEREVPPKRPRDGGEDVPLRRKNRKTGHGPCTVM